MTTCWPSWTGPPSPAERSVGQLGQCGGDLRRGFGSLRCELISEPLRRASGVVSVLSVADLREASLDQADLQYADLQGANLRGASLNCDFRFASLGGTDFSDTEPWSSTFEFASSDDSTTWPAGFVPEAEEIYEYGDLTPVTNRRSRASTIRVIRAKAPAADRSGRLVVRGRSSPPMSPSRRGTAQGGVQA